MQAGPRFSVDKMMKELFIWLKTQPPQSILPISLHWFCAIECVKYWMDFHFFEFKLYHIRNQFYGMVVSTNRQTKRKIVWKILIIVFASIVSSILKPSIYCRKILKFSFTHTFSFKQKSTEKKNRFISFTWILR